MNKQVIFETLYQMIIYGWWFIVLIVFVILIPTLYSFIEKRRIRRNILIGSSRQLSAEDMKTKEAIETLVQKGELFYDYTDDIDFSILTDIMIDIMKLNEADASSYLRSWHFKNSTIATMLKERLLLEGNRKNVHKIFNEMEVEETGKKGILLFFGKENVSKAKDMLAD